MIHSKNMASTIIFLFLLPLLILPNQVLVQAQVPSQAPPPAADVCNGVFVSYTYVSGQKLPPDLKTNPAQQPYRFESQLSVLNNGLEDLKSWQVFVGFQHDEFLVSASNAVLTDGSPLPIGVGNGTVFAGYPNSDLKTAIETAGDQTQMGVQVNLVGTQFGVGAPNVPMPQNISLVNDGWKCPKPTIQGKNVMEVCCVQDQNFKTNVTTKDGFLPRQTGDLTITYDVTRTYADNYWARVTISNHNPLGRLDNWQLSWDWMRDEFINTMQGAYPSVVDSSDCLFGKQGQYYQALDFSTVLNCEKRPTIIDMPLEKANDTKFGMIPFCCRNGTILPPSMDPSKSVSAFDINVFKMPPDLNRSDLTPPQNWQINGTLNPSYKCGPPVRVSPTRFSNPNGLSSDTTAISSWQVVCNITKPKGVSPKCCVSFSAYYNESFIPCQTCACGCATNPSSSCNPKTPALFLPAQALLIPFENRTNLATAWASLHHFPVSNPLPCGDNCGVSINWNLATDYSSGWSARITIFNWDNQSFADWFAAVQFDKAAAGFEKVYSFNGSAIAPNGVNNTIFMQGLPDFNYLVGEVDGADTRKDFRVPGKQQSVISFTKKKLPPIDVPGGDGFPSKVFFNGEECSLPSIIPTGGSYRRGASSMISSIIVGILIFHVMR